MGRQLSPDPLAYVVSLRFTARQLLTAKELAAAAGMTLADYLRQPVVVQDVKLARAETKAATSAGHAPASGVPRLAKASRPPDGLLEFPARHELRKQAVNLTQVSRQLSEHRLAAPPSIDQLLADIAVLDRPPSKPRLKRPLIDAATLKVLRGQGANLNAIAHQLNAQSLVAPHVIGDLVEQIRSVIAPAVASVRDLPAVASPEAGTHGA